MDNREHIEKRTDVLFSSHAGLVVENMSPADKDTTASAVDMAESDQKMATNPISFPLENLTHKPGRSIISKCFTNKNCFNKILRTLIYKPNVNLEQ